MTETQNQPPSATPTDTARRQWEAGRAGGTRIVWILALVFVSLAAGIGGTLLALRFQVLSFGAAPSGQPAPAAAGPGGPSGHEGMPGMGGEAPGGQPAGTSGQAVYISPARQQLIGVRTAAITHRALETTIRTVGTIAFDETRVQDIHTKISGWVERLDVNYVGMHVRRRQPLFSVYSPELVSTQNEYLLALKAEKQLSRSQFPETREGALSLVSATRERLKLWDITDAEIARLEQTGQARKSLTLYSPFNGIVLERNTFAGHYLTPDFVAFKVADLSTIWVFGEVFEYEMRMVKLGDEAQIEFPYGQASRRLKGKITFIYPEIDPQTRRLKLRIEFPNPGLEFKPGSYVTVTIQTPGAHHLAIPKEAVIDTGVKRYAILARRNGYFEPREIEVGEPVDEFYPVVKGLEPGDRVVTSAQFLIDSETNLQAAMKAMSMSMPGMDMGGGGQEGVQTPAQPGPAGKAAQPPDHSGHKPDVARPPMDHSKHEQ